MSGGRKEEVFILAVYGEERDLSGSNLYFWRNSGRDLKISQMRWEYMIKEARDLEKKVCTTTELRSWDLLVLLKEMERNDG